MLEARAYLALAIADPYNSGEAERGKRMAAEAGQAAMAHLGPKHPLALLLKYVEGLVHLQCGDEAAGARLLREAVTGMRASLGVGHPRLVRAVQILAPVLQKLVRKRRHLPSFTEPPSCALLAPSRMRSALLQLGQQQ